MSRDDIHEPRWPAFVAMLAAAFLYLALPEPLSLGPSWLLLAIVLVLLIPIVETNRRGQHRVAHALTFIANGAITVALIASLIFLIQGLPAHRESPTGPAAFGSRALVYEHFGVCAVVLEAGRGRSAGTRSAARPRGKLVSFSANDDARRPEFRLVAPLYGLSLPGL